MQSINLPGLAVFKHFSRFGLSETIIRLAEYSDLPHLYQAGLSGCVCSRV